VSHGSQRQDILSPIRDKPCLASITTTFGRVRFTYVSGGSGWVAQMRFYGEDWSGVFFDLDFEWDTSGFLRDIRRTAYV